MEELKTWRDVRITSQMPLDAIVDFANVLNQRLCAVEDLIKIKKEDGSEITLTDFYKEDIKRQMEENARAAQQPKEEPKKVD